MLKTLATYKGKNGSCGFINSCTYEIAIYLIYDSTFLVVGNRKNEKVYYHCMYASLSAIFNNWEKFIPF